MVYSSILYKRWKDQRKENSLYDQIACREKKGITCVYYMVRHTCMSNNSDKEYADTVGYINVI